MKGTRSIHYSGHIKMMAATQPFVSGAISKTVNLPENSTVEDIYKAYVEAWKLGIKAIAIYRDNSKRSQPLATKKDMSHEDAAKQSAEEIAAAIRRRRLPDERHAITHKFNIAGHEGYLTVGLYEDGMPGEIFIVMAKEGSTLSGVMDAFATSISMALQYGVPLTALIQKFSHMRFEPSGFTSNKQIPMAKSFLDYIFRWLATKFLSIEEQNALGIMQTETVDSASSLTKTSPIVLSNSISSNVTSSLKTTTIGFHVNGADMNAKIEENYSSKTTSLNALAFQISDDAPPCSSCGSSMMVRQGACYRCMNCGSQGGCG